MALAVRNPPANAGDNRGADLIPESERSLGGGNRFQYLPGKSYGQRSLAAYSPWGCKRVVHDLVTKGQQQR